MSHRGIVGGEQQVACPRCGTAAGASRKRPRVGRLTLIVCHQCRHEFVHEDVRLADAEPKSEAPHQVLVCPSCQLHQLRDQGETCRGCGAYLLSLEAAHDLQAARSQGAVRPCAACAGAGRRFTPAPLVFLAVGLVSCGWVILAVMDYRRFWPSGRSHETFAFAVVAGPLCLWVFLSGAVFSRTGWFARCKACSGAGVRKRRRKRRAADTDIDGAS